MIALIYWLVVIGLMCCSVALLADMHQRHARKVKRDGWREHRAHMDSLEPRRWDKVGGIREW